MVRRITIALGTATLALSLAAGTAFAAGNPNGTGQPSQDCSVESSSPAGFNTAGFAHAGTVYANPADTGSQGGIASGNNVHVVSQYDVACYQVSQTH
ncbi:MAG TPA: hypothetical protein VKR30_12585 [Candidatus Limnocylindrales bacterium]|nr:hypothetical protein [Candidatus Limnocylindrales bacterium]